MPRLAVRDIPYSIAFNAASTAITISDNAALRPASFTLELWLKNNGHLSGNYNNVWSQTSTLGWADGWGLAHLANAGNRSITCWHGRYDTIANYVSFNELKGAINGWDHIVITYDSLTQTKKGYLNGVSVGSVNANALTQVSTSIQIGVYSTQYYWNGGMAKWKYYNRALSATEISQRFYRNANITNGLVASWDTVTGSGTSLIDSIGGYNGTIANGAWSSDTPMKQKKAVQNYNYSAIFNGSTSKIVSSANTGITGTNPWTMRVKFNPQTFTAYDVLCGIGVAAAGTSVDLGLRSGAIDSTLNATTTVTETTKSPRIGDWQEGVATFAGGAGGAVTVYLNGLVRATGTMTPNLGNGPFNIGTFDQHSLVGNLNDACLWNRALTATEVSDMYYTGQVPTSGLIRRYLLTDNSSTPADTSATGDTSTTVAITWSSTNTAGKARTTFAAQQNLVTRSNRPDLTPWLRNTGVTATANTNEVTDPFGGNSASKLAYDGSGLAGSYKLAQSFGISAAPVHTHTFYARLASGSRNFTVGDNINYLPFTATTNWQKISLSYPETPGSSAGMTLSIYDQGDNSPFTLYLYEFQTVYANWSGPYPVHTDASPVNTGNIRNRATSRTAVS